MDFKDSLNMFIPRRDIIEKYMEGFDIPSWVDDGVNDGEDYAIMVASALKYSQNDFYGKLVFAVESHASNGYDVRYFAHTIYKESLSVSPSQWEECMFGYAGMNNIFHSIALLKADVLGGQWIGVGYMDFDYLRRRVALLTGVMNDNKVFYRGTKIINFDVLKTVGNVLRSIHNASALFKHGIPLDASINDAQSALYSSYSAGVTSFRDLSPAELEVAVNVIIQWCQNGSYSNKNIMTETLFKIKSISPDILWELISCGVVDDYQRYVGLPKEYVRALLS